MKDEFGRKVMTKFVGLKAKTFSYLIDDSNGDKKAKGAKKCVIKRKFEIQNDKKATQLENKINYLEKNEIDMIVFKKIIKNL